MSDVKPCPFCGLDAVTSADGQEVYCYTPGCAMWSRETPIEQWNARALSPSPVTPTSEPSVLERARAAWKADSARCDLEDEITAAPLPPPEEPSEDVSEIAAWLGAEERAGFVREPYHSYLKRLLRALRASREAAAGSEDVTDAEVADWPQRFAVFAFSIDGYESLDEDAKQVCKDAAEWARARVNEALASRRASSPTKAAQ